MKRNYTAPKGSDRQPLTIRQMEALKQENIRKTAEQLNEMELDILLTPKKPVKSVPKLRKVIQQFFADNMDDPYITVNSLAKAIGYADEDAMQKDAFNIANRPEYNAELRKAISLIEDLMTRRMLAIADAAGDSKGYQYALQRMDKKRDKYDPDSAMNETQVKVNIQMQENEGIKSMLNDRLASLLSAQKGSAIDIPSKKIEAIPEPVPIASDGNADI